MERYIFLTILCLIKSSFFVNCLLEIEHGFYKDTLKLGKQALSDIHFAKTMYKGSQIMFKIDCECNGDNGKSCTNIPKIAMSFKLSVNKCQNPEREEAKNSKYSPTKKIFVRCTSHIKVDQDTLNQLVPEEPPEPVTTSMPTTAVTSTNIPSNDNPIKATLKTATIAIEPNVEKPDTESSSEEETSQKPEPKPKEHEKKDQKAAEKPEGKPEENENKDLSSPPPLRKRRAASEPSSTSTTVTKAPAPPHKNNVGENKLPLTLEKGLFVLNMNFTIRTSEGVDHVDLKIYIESKNGDSFLSALNWPMLPFYGFMSLLYLAFAIGWFLASCCNWKDLLRLQFWIGGIIAIGMLENALFYAEYQHISSHGSENGLLYFAELISCVKRALARILVVIVSMGFGIVKPRLGQTLHKVLAVGILYFILAAIEGCLRVRDGGMMRSKSQQYALIPVTLLDVALCWWVFTSLVQTTRTLRIRKNVVKLTLYHHFTNTLIFTVIASLAYLIWSIKELKFTNCWNISTIWLQDALWPFLFAIILAVVMILWRPSNNNQRYAFTPLGLDDTSDYEDDDMTLSDAFGDMKMRTRSESGSVAKNRNKADDDLKWVEENIPSVPSTLLPTIDSDEEILTTKFEMSKMD